MKKLLAGLAAASMVATPALAQPFQGRDHGPSARSGQPSRAVTPNRGYNQPRANQQRFNQQRFGQQRYSPPRVQYRNFQRGERFDARYARNYRVISQPSAYRLYNAPRGYQWVQSGNDALLVGLAGGVIATILANVLN